MNRFKDFFWDKLESLAHDLKNQYFCEHVQTRITIIDDAILQIEHGHVLDAKSDVTFESLRQSAETLVEELLNKTSMVPQCGDKSCRGCYQTDMGTTLQHMCAITAQIAYQSVSCGHPPGM